MSGVNKALIVGQLGFDPEVREVKSGSGSFVTQLRVATSEWTGSGADRKERTEWHRVTMFGRLAEIGRDYLKRGALVYVEGRLRTSEWVDKDGKTRRTTEIVADVMRMLDGRGGRRGESEMKRESEPRATAPPKGPNGDLFEGTTPRRAA